MEMKREEFEAYQARLKAALKEETKEAKEVREELMEKEIGGFKDEIIYLYL